MVARLGTRLARSCQAEKALARIYFAYYENPLRRVSFLAQLINELLPGDLELQVSSVTRLHLHPHYATALASLEDSSMLPVDQNTMRFYNRYTVDDGFGGMGLGGEATRLSGLLSEHPVLLMGNHGVTTIGESVAMAFGQMYLLLHSAVHVIDILRF